MLVSDQIGESHLEVLEGFIPRAELDMMTFEASQIEILSISPLNANNSVFFYI